MKHGPTRHTANVYVDGVLQTPYFVGNTKPALLGLDVSIVHTAVQVARRNGWLTSNGVGLSGGVLTEKGNEVFLAAKGPERLARLMNRKEQ